MRSALLVTILAGSLAAQSVNPPIAIYEGAALRTRGSLVIDNPTLFPIVWVVEPKKFDVGCGGDMVFAPIDTQHMQLKLSAMSGRLGAKQRTTVFYDIQVDSVPAWLAIVVALTPGRPQTGLNIKLELPHMVYLMQREPVKANDVTVESAEFDSATKTLRVRVTNHSAGLTRISDLQGKRASGGTYSLEACPLFPNSTRDFEFTWADALPPAGVIVKFNAFSLDHPVTFVKRPATRDEAASCGSCPPR